MRRKLIACCVGVGLVAAVATFWVARCIPSKVSYVCDGARHLRYGVFEGSIRLTMTSSRPWVNPFADASMLVRVEHHNMLLTYYSNPPVLGELMHFKKDGEPEGMFSFETLRIRFKEDEREIGFSGYCKRLDD